MDCGHVARMRPGSRSKGCFRLIDSSSTGLMRGCVRAQGSHGWAPTVMCAPPSMCAPRKGPRVSSTSCGRRRSATTKATRLGRPLAELLVHHLPVISGSQAVSSAPGAPEPGSGSQRAAPVPRETVARGRIGPSPLRESRTSSQSPTPTTVREPLLQRAVQALPRCRAGRRRIEPHGGVRPVPEGAHPVQRRLGRHRSEQQRRRPLEVGLRHEAEGGSGSRPALMAGSVGSGDGALRKARAGNHADDLQSRGGERVRGGL